jgi:hypothetical protein
VKAKDEKPTKAQVFQELIRKVLHKEVELEEVTGVGVQGESKQKPRKASIPATAGNRQMVM